MNGAENDPIHYAISRPVFALLLVASGLGGGSLGVTLSPQMEREALTACYDNSQIALDVVAQHGDEINRLNNLLIERTRDRFTGDDHARYARDIDRQLELIRRELQALDELHPPAELLRRIERLEER